MSQSIYDTGRCFRKHLEGFCRLWPTLLRRNSFWSKWPGPRGQHISCSSTSIRANERRGLPSKKYSRQGKNSSIEPWTSL